MRNLIIAAAAVSLSVAAQAQDDNGKADAPPEVVAKLFDCRAIEDGDLRLACFDREVDSVMQAQASKELVIADRDQVKEARRGLFGFSLPKIGLFGGDDEEDEVNEIVANVSSAREMANGRYTFELEGGAQWIQSDNTPVLRRIEKGEQVVIEKGALGSYRAKVGSRRAFRVKRVD